MLTKSENMLMVAQKTHKFSIFCFYSCAVRLIGHKHWDGVVKIVAFQLFGNFKTFKNLNGFKNHIKKRSNLPCLQYGESCQQIYKYALYYLLLLCCFALQYHTWPLRQSGSKAQCRDCISFSFWMCVLTGKLYIGYKHVGRLTFAN